MYKPMRSQLQLDGNSRSDSKESAKIKYEYEDINTRRNETQRETW